MNRNLYKLLESDRKVIAKFAADKKSSNDTLSVLKEHFPMLNRIARCSADECKKIQKRSKDPEFLPGLFDRCRIMCESGVLPDTDSIINFLNEKIKGTEIIKLPLAITCVLIDISAEAVRNNDVEQLKNAVSSLQKMRETDFEYITEKLFGAEKILMNDPAGTYEDMSIETKAEYRRKISDLAAVNGKSDEETAAEILEKAVSKKMHIGNFIFSTVFSTKRGNIFLIMEALIPALVCISSAILSDEWFLSFLLFFPVWEILRHPIESSSMRGVNHRKMMKLNINSEKVSKANALITLSVILPSYDKMDELKTKLEDIYLSNAGDNIRVCCLGDFKGSDSPRKPEDKHIVNALSNAIEELNKKYGGGFLAAVRSRSYSETQNEFIGKERKRGAIRDLIRAVKGDEKNFLSLTGDKEGFNETKYIIALDYDSKPVFNSARKLISVAEHPINKPVIMNGKVVSGYGILTPKTVNSLESSCKTFFSSVMSHDSGISSYDNYSCERYNSLFGESIFCGKGLINVDAYYEVLDNTLPRERILSHDIIEGEYLRTGFVSDVQFIEDFPSSSDSYFKRLHRWVRGDWQNAFFLFKNSPLNFVSKYKIFDNLRRSITPVICLTAIIYSAFYQGYAGVTAAVISMFAVCSSDFFAGINAVMASGIGSVTDLYYSKRIPEGLGCILRGIMLIAYAPREAFVNLDAIIRALWRSVISGDNLLEWTTSAEQDKETSLLASFMPSIITASLLFVFGLPIHRLTGIIILFDIPLILFGNAPAKNKKSNVTSEQREYLISHASAMWEYFEELCGEENNFLPPDNIQYAPHRAVARRTSPTNIGLMLACFVAARDLGFISSEELYRRLEKSLESIDKLEKHKGNLLNWYSTETLEAINPRFVSAVDSGNFICCLTAIKEAVREYASEYKKLEVAAEKIEKIIAETDLTIMYNKQRNLFCIGINPDSGDKTDSCYDLYMSEIRMTSYLAVARKIVPEKHWMALDRPVIKRGRYYGLASWTGTMFEYFMADIFIPSPFGSLSDEALKFCLQSQRKKAGRNPFGMSESAFYAFDADLNYQYKAHGVQKLALKRDLNKENVISPYSSFLTLNIAPKLSVENLKKLEKSGMKGKYGFYEAMDYTPGRNSGRFSIINSFMVHHVGMSLLSADNLLNNSCMQKRFMQDKYMRGARTLLEEKPMHGKEVFKDVIADSVIPYKSGRIKVKSSEKRKTDPMNTRYSIMSNGRMTLCVSDNGRILSMFDGEKIFDATINDIFECGKEEYRFCSEESFVTISDNMLEFQNQSSDMNLILRIWLLNEANGIIKKYIVENKNKEKSIKGRLYIDKPKTESDMFFMSGFISGEYDKNPTKHEMDFEVSVGEKKTFVFATAAEATSEEASDLFEKMKTNQFINSKAMNPFSAEPYLRALSEKYLPKIAEKKAEPESEMIHEISRKYPLIFVRLSCKENVESVRSYITFNKILRNCGIKNTLIICSCIDRAEEKTVLQTIERFMSEEGCHLMLGISGGAFILSEKSIDNSEYEKFKENSAVFVEI